MFIATAPAFVPSNKTKLFSTLNSKMGSFEAVLNFWHIHELFGDNYNDNTKKLIGGVFPFFNKNLLKQVLSWKYQDDVQA